jgi:tagaturonate reductase
MVTVSRVGKVLREPLPRLNAKLLTSGFTFPAGLRVGELQKQPERVLQFGEGNFLRGFVDWMIHRMNGKGLFNGRVVLVQPIPQGQAETINAQDGVYTLLLRGMQAGKIMEEREIITSVSRGIDTYKDWTGLLACAENPDLRFIVSNTTEAGIAFRAEDKPIDTPPVSFPGKLTAFLYKRWQAFKGDKARGFIVLPCELIERNGDNLKRTVLQTAAAWNLPAECVQWIETANVFTNTLVDRIVTGYPRDEERVISDNLGYKDALLDTGELFHTWVIEATGTSVDALRKELPLVEAGLNVIWTDNMTPYRERKVRILNGAHTSLVAAAYLSGCDTVKEAMDDPLLAGFLKKALNEEILPTLDLPKADLESFAAATLERFGNPFIKHLWMSISLNSVSKYKARVLPSVKEYLKRKGALPRRLTFALAALIAFYRGIEIHENALVGHRAGRSYLVQDDVAALELFRDAWASNGGIGGVVDAALGAQKLWGSDLRQIPGLTDAVVEDLGTILRVGMRKALETLG